MATATSRLQIQIDAKNNASGPLKQVAGDLQGLDKAAGSIAGGLGALAGAAGIAGIAALGAAAGGAAVDMAKSAAEAERLGTAFDNLASNAGQASEEMLAAMREASQGTISNTELIASANRAMMLGVADSAEEMAQLLEIAGARGKAMGLSTAQAFSDLVTGLGRQSAMILDNLGITVDAEAANEAYAQQISKTAATLTDAEKKQALLNAVIKDSTDILNASEGASGDAASNFERMDASIQNAKVALGAMFSPAIAAIAQSLADAVNQVTEAAEGAGEKSTLDDLRVAAEMSAQAMAAANREILSLQQRQEDLAAANKIGSDEWLRINDLIEQASAKYKKAEGAQLAYNQALLESGAALSTVDHAQVEAGLSLSQLGMAARVAGDSLAVTEIKAADLATTLGMLKAQSDATSTALAGIASSAMSAVHAAASAAVGIMPSGEIARIYTQNTKRMEEQVKVMKSVGMTTEEIDFRMQELAKRASLPFDLAVEAAREAEKANNAVAKSVDTLSAEYSNLQSKVQGVLSGALDPGVGVDPDDVLAALGFPREDEINENARRLADIAKNGLKGQDWLAEFQREVPDIWQMIRLAQNPQEEAARLLRDFQDGLLTSPIDKGMAKEIVRRQIMGEQSMAAFANEIARELATEMGIPLQQALAATQGTIGGGTGAGGEMMRQFGDSALAEVEAANTGGVIVDTTIAQLRSRYSLLQTAGRDAAKAWGDAFVGYAAEHVPTALIDILATLVTPAVQARFAQQSTMQGATP